MTVISERGGGAIHWYSAALLQRHGRFYPSEGGANDHETVYDVFSIFVDDFSRDYKEGDFRVNSLISSIIVVEVCY